MKKTILLTTVTTLIFSTFLPGVALADVMDNPPTAPVSQKVQPKSDILEQFPTLQMDNVNKSDELAITENMQKQIDTVIANAQKKRALGIDDIASLVAIVGACYAGGKYAAKQANKRFGLTVKSYKANRWWWRAGISASVGIPAALGFDDYFYGL